MGAYHGEEGFRTFTRPRSVMVASRLSPMRLARPPFGAPGGADYPVPVAMRLRP
jgi:hypothetical protein